VPQRKFFCVINVIITIIASLPMWKAESPVCCLFQDLEVVTFFGKYFVNGPPPLLLERLGTGKT
jgi:hypothetical protein